MKKFLFAFMAGLIPALAVTIELKAQTFKEVAFTPSIISKMANTGTADNPIELNMVNTKALRNFRKYYKINDEKWFDGKDCTTAIFFTGDITNIVYYNKKGNWTNFVKIYKEPKMPKDIRKMIRQEYYDYEILVVEEVEDVVSILNPTYLVVIKGENDTKWIRIKDDGMDVYKEFKKN